MNQQSLCVKLPKELASFVSAKIQSGEYSGEDVVIRDGLELLKSMDGYRAYQYQRLRDEINVRIDQAERGLGKLWDKAATGRIKAKGRKLASARKNGKN